MSESVHGAVCALVLIVVVRIQCRDGINMQYLKRTSTGPIDISVRARAPSALGRGILNIAIHL